MELEFDKEIDAILRKARSGETVTTVKSQHLDADSIAAFAENALPQKTKLLYMEHFADCDPCRKVLSQTILTRTEADATAASSVVTTASTAVPWYSKLLRTPNLAMAMGALVLVFGGVFGYLVLKNRNAANDATVSQVREREQPKGGPYVSDEQPLSDMNSNAAAANTMSNSAATVANKPAMTEPTMGNPAGRGAADAPIVSTDGVTTDGVDLASQPKTAAAAPPPPAAAKSGLPADERNERKDDADKAKETERDTKLSKQEFEDRMAREAVPQPAKKTGPNRAAGPRQNQQNTLDSNMGQNTQNAVGGMMATPVKSAGGKKFQNRDGAWYDTSYHGQATKNVSRGTDEFNKLDSGLRSIANSIGGVVVVVWKGTAYRIR
jgi:hypothetical protein